MPPSSPFSSHATTVAKSVFLVFIAIVFSSPDLFIWKAPNPNLLSPPTCSSPTSSSPTVFSSSPSIRYNVSSISPSKVYQLIGVIGHEKSYEILCKTFDHEAKAVLEIQCSDRDKLLHILALLKLDLVQKKVLIFTNTIDTGFRLKLFLEHFGIKSAVLNAELPVNSRLHILEAILYGS
ncbi:hypothetical protein L6452_03087 [Arctium lappa]|uniref:Uncharacterized protein n=1 Tax=Arctium lappa TaxID=4217 RepID=A0ACB9FL91_ARCLA|nr:hypothetical protein L6452_03087 [Arctium lappa]